MLFRFRTPLQQSVNADATISLKMVRFARGKVLEGKVQLSALTNLPKIY
jgi:hypothetical protein